MVWRYSTARERRDNRTLNLQVERAQYVSDGERAVKKDRLMNLSGDKPVIDQDRTDQARIVIGLKGYVTDIHQDRPPREHDLHRKHSIEGT